MEIHFLELRAKIYIPSTMTFSVPSLNFGFLQTGLTSVFGAPGMLIAITRRCIHRRIRLLQSSAIASTMSLKQRSGRGLKDKNRLAICSFGHLPAQHLPVCEIGPDTEYVREEVFRMYPPDQRLFSGTVENGRLRLHPSCEQPSRGHTTHDPCNSRCRHPA
jgi:hypothetical protein